MRLLEGHIPTQPASGLTCIIPSTRKYPNPHLAVKDGIMLHSKGISTSEGETPLENHVHNLFCKRVGPAFGSINFYSGKGL